MNPDIVFYQQYGVPYFGVLSLAAHLKHAGFKSDALIESLEKDPIEKLKQFKPRMIGISLLSPEHNWLIQASHRIRRAFPDVPIIVGGVHAMFYPEEILSATAADLVCHSEAEDLLPRVINELSKARPNWASIEGLAYRDNGGIRINERAQLANFKDDIIEDRAIYYDRYPQLAKDTVHRFFSSRGCPYKCSFCYNANIHDIFKGKGAYVRQKGVENFIQEIRSQQERYPIKIIYFYDDLFTFNKEWLKGFLARYKREIGTPFMCTARANILDEDIARMLAEAGCRTVCFGIETGNYMIRRDILKKDIADSEIIRCGRILKRYSMKIQTTNMFCLPGEKLEDAYRTIELNIKAKADYAFSALFVPFPKTEITNYCISRGFIKRDYSLGDLPYSFLTSSVLSLEDKEAIINVHRLAFFFVKWPRLYRVFKRWIKCRKLDFIFRFIFLVGTLIRHKEERNISMWAALRYAWRLRGSF